MARIAHLAVKVTDIAAPSEFLEDVFGFTHMGTVVHPTTTFNATEKTGGHTSRHLSDGVMDLTLVKYDDDATAEPGSSAGGGPCIHHFGIEAEAPQSFAAAIAANGGEVLSAPDMPTLKFRAPGGIMSEVVPTGWFSRESIAANAERRGQGLHMQTTPAPASGASRPAPADGKPRLTHIAIKVADVRKTCAFFERVFGFKAFAEYWERDHVSKHLTDGALDLAIIKFDSDKTDAARASGRGPCIHHFGIDVPESEMAQYAEKLRRQGCEFISDPGAVTVKFRLPGGGGIAEIAPFDWHFRKGGN